MPSIRNIIVIGASAGGFSAIKSVVADLTLQSDAAVFIVIHMSRKSNAATIAEMLQRKTSLHCIVATNGMPIERGRLYLAPSDHHIMVKDNMILVNQGPPENKYRPAIDVLFRSAAVYYGHRTIGIVLSGLLDDGTSGMSAIKRCGGICIIQDPSEAEFADMPLSVLNNVAVDHTLPLLEIAFAIEKIMSDPLPAEQPVPTELQIETRITEKMMTNMDDIKKIGDGSDFVCPDCGGQLYAVKNDPAHRYRCYTGHVYTEKSLQDMQDSKIEEAIWVSIRMLEEKSNLLKLMATRKESAGDQNGSERFQNRADQVHLHVSTLKNFLMRIHETDQP